MKIKQFQLIQGDPIVATEDRRITLESSLWSLKSVVVVVEGGVQTNYPMSSVLWYVV